ncbi:crotonyl-CoA reductase [Acidimicrobium ferrooxidans DSM 10331]|uniref:Crotonyl-CoA reductase n=1 Tax=Acidimicrobium ferrooxidans (strain DSM 10331 / JCM 15462 / NBRC 103882 / ICP) TaxID=525909 RepID=C7M1M7_ACIFD|nr:crotonyl-CoA carboxylase/reductase [Acidimicrobium ferrooxidans]ACU53076.1 crotonyl-CoA reductase [Acidimicrobium ferrooxidans DSM 10331]
MPSFLTEAVLAGADPAELAATPVPDHYRACYVQQSDIERVAHLDPAVRDPGTTLHIGDVPMPELGPDEVLVAVMASSINYNTIWSALFEPVPTFQFLARLGRSPRPLDQRHNLPYHVIGSDAAGVIVRTGPAVRRWQIGDRVVVHCNAVDDQDPSAHDDSMLASEQRIWGYETNFGGLAEFTIVRANQLMPKPRHLSWEEAAVNPLTNSTAYRMLVSPNGAQMRQGQVVLIWGATGGIGSYGVQYVLNGGGIPVGVVSSPRKAALLRRMGCEYVIDRSERNYQFWRDDDTQDETEWRRFGQDIRDLVGEDPDIVFEHPGRATMGASVYVAKRGGTIVTCAATSGHWISYDNRHLWMKLKTIKGSHFANYREAWEANRLIERGRIQPVLSATYPLEEVAEAVRTVRQNRHEGKVGILCLSPTPGLGIDDPEARTAIGEDRIALFARFAAEQTTAPEQRGGDDGRA